MISSPLLDQLHSQRRKFRQGVRRNAIAYYATLYGPLVLSALVVVALQLPGLPKDAAVTQATGLSGAAAVLSTFGGFGGFKEKWMAHRAALLEVDLLILAAAQGAPSAYLVERMQEVMRTFNASWNA